MRLAVEQIAKRKADDRKFDLMVAERLAQGITGAMPGLAMDKKSGRSIQKYVHALRFIPRDPEEDLPSTEALTHALRDAERPR